MKPIIIDMKEMSDSTEVYESRPNPVMASFIYLILAMFVIAIVWMGFCKMDVVVKGTGTVNASSEVATVTNQVGGVLVERRVDDGQIVKKDDVIYVVNHDEMLVQLDSLTEQLADNMEHAKMLGAYEEWLQSGAEFGEELENNLYYAEISSRKQLVELGMNSTEQSYADELAVYDAKLDANAGLSNYYYNRIDKSRELIQAIKNKKNTFEKEESYYWNAVENYLQQYQILAKQYDDKINELKTQQNDVQKQIDELIQQKEKLQDRVRMIEDGILTVSGNDIEEDAGILQQMQAIEREITSCETTKATIEQSVRESNIQKSNALIGYEKENIAAIESSIMAYEQNIKTNEAARVEYSNGQSTLLEQGIEIELENLATKEKYSVAGELENCRQLQQQLEGHIEELQQNIDNATVKATIDGQVNFNSVLAEGDYISAGERVLSIIPDTESGTFVVRSYIENKDIAKVHEGMEVTYEIAAYPAREYGTMRGKVSFISADLKVNQNGSAYYLVETSVDAEEMYNQLGEHAELKVGMLCETRIIVEKKSVLHILIEKLFHK